MCASHDSEAMVGIVTGWAQTVPRPRGHGTDGGGSDSMVSDRLVLRSLVDSVRRPDPSCFALEVALGMVSEGVYGVQGLQGCTGLT